MKYKTPLARFAQLTALSGLIFIACCLVATAQTTFKPDGVPIQPTSFTYQGRLTEAGLSGGGTFDFQFALYSVNSGGTAIGTETVSGVTVTNGVFTVELDFGSEAFPDEERYLEIRVKRPSDTDYVFLNPRQRLTSTPFAIRSKTATTADTATNAATANNALNVGGTPAADIIKEGDTRLTDSRTPTAGSGDYIQNQNSAAQTSTNFSIDGSGAANVFNATTQFNIGGDRVFSIGGTGNTFAGAGSGAANPTGNNNSFFGRGAGFSTTTGVSNSFFGNLAGRTNLSGNNNSFFGRDAGRNNDTGNENAFFGVNAGFNSTGSQNVFLGVQAGNSNITGSNNTVIGTSANVSGSGLTFATALGSGAVVGANNTVVLGRSADTVQIPGNLDVAGTLTATINGAGITNLNASNIATGTLNNARLGIVPIANGGTGSATQNFVDLTTAQTIAGNKTFSAILSGNVVNAATQFNLGGSRVLISNSGLENVFAGNGSGAVNDTGNGNAFFGNNSGNKNTTGSNNSFFGRSAGFSNVSGSGNSFFGLNAGISNTGNSNSFFGALAGDSNTSGSGNLFFGVFAGNANTDGNNNLFFGNSTGNANISGGNNSFFGAGAGISTTGSNNVFIGVAAGTFNVGGGNNTMLGANATVNSGAGSLNYATAIGAGATVFTSNTIVLGRADGSDVVRVPGLGAAGFTALCRNNNNEISTCSSSLRYKTNIAPFTSGLDLIRRLRPISYNWKDGGAADVGFGAEDVAAVNSLFTVFGKDGQIEGVKYDRFSVLFVNAFQEQQTQIENKQAQIDALQEQIKQQQTAIDDLKKIVCAGNPTAAVCQ